jgi:transcriptional/translational regulatory protein YebC/TACO1
MFEQKGVIIVENPKDAEKLTLTAIDAGALDIKEDNHSFEIYTEPKDLEKVKKAIEAIDEKITTAEISKIAKTEIRIDDPNEAKKILALMDALEEQETVSEVFANFNIDEKVLSR